MSLDSLVDRDPFADANLRELFLPPPISKASVTESVPLRVSPRGIVIALLFVGSNLAAFLLGAALYPHPTSFSHPTAQSSNPVVQRPSPIASTPITAPVAEMLKQPKFELEPIRSALLLPARFHPAPPADGAGTIYAVSDHFAWVHFPTSVDDLDGERVTLQSGGRSPGVFVVTRVKGQTAVVDGPVSSLSAGNSVICKVVDARQR